MASTLKQSSKRKIKPIAPHKHAETFEIALRYKTDPWLTPVSHI